jgi:hypothetical protein
MRTLCFLVAVGLLGSFAPWAPSARADDAQRAKDLFQEGTRYFDLGQFDKAIDAWQSGYREKPDAVFLYNIAQAYRLAGDLNKAIFFYKGFLRNSPKAHNRPEVEQRIAGLQKQLAEQEAAKGAAPAAPPVANGEPASAAVLAPATSATPPSPARSNPPSSGSTASTTTVDVSAPPSSSEMSSASPGSSATPPEVAGTANASGAAVVEVLRPLDFAVGVGVDGWTSGVQGKANASFAFMLAGGYTMGRDPVAPFRFRLGGSFGYTFLKEAASRETFLSLLVVPTLLIRASSRVGFFGELGLGVVGISGLQPTSALLDHNVTLKISGTQGLLEIRPALGVQFQLSPPVGLFLSAASDYSPKGQHFYQAINRTEVLVGLSLRR